MGAAATNKCCKVPSFLRQQCQKISLFSQNFLSLRVYYSSKGTTEVVETPKYENIGAIAASVGGAISLYIGMSFASLLEFVELAIR